MVVNDSRYRVVVRIREFTAQSKRSNVCLLVKLALVD